MAASSWLLSLVTFVHCLVAVLSVSCNLPDEKSETSCLSKISEGIKCQGDSEMQKCYKMCEQFASAYIELGQQAKVFEQVICDKGLTEKVMAQQECAKEIYLQCKDVYKPDAKPNECTNTQIISGRCMKLVKGKISDQHCEELMNIIVPAMAAECGCGSSVVAQVATVGLAIFMSILSKELMFS